jgi:hypothetical protein
VTAVYFIDALADHVRGSFELTPQDANALLTLHAERSHEEEAFAAFVRVIIEGSKFFPICSVRKGVPAVEWGYRQRGEGRA